MKESHHTDEHLVSFESEEDEEAGEVERLLAALDLGALRLNKPGGGGRKEKLPREVT